MGSIKPSEMGLVLSYLTQDGNQITLVVMAKFLWQVMPYFFPLGAIHFQDKQYSG